MEVNMSCDREAYTLEHCAEQAHEVTQKTADELVLVRKVPHYEGGSKENSSRLMWMVCEISDPTWTMVRDILDPKNEIWEYTMDVFLAEILAVCLDTVQEHAGVPANAVVIWETSAAAFIQEFIQLVEGAWALPTATMANQLASYLLHQRRQDTHRANGGAYGNKCMGYSDKIIKCYATAFTYTISFDGLF
jgi:hypothetical protein